MTNLIKIFNCKLYMCNYGNHRVLYQTHGVWVDEYCYSSISSQTHLKLNCVNHTPKLLTEPSADLTLAKELFSAVIKAFPKGRFIHKESTNTTDRPLA